MITQEVEHIADVPHGEDGNYRAGLSGPAHQLWQR